MTSDPRVRQGHPLTRGSAGLIAILGLAAAGSIACRQRDPGGSAASPTAPQIERLLDRFAEVRFSRPSGNDAEPSRTSPRHRWTAADIARDWERVPQGAGILLRSPRLDFATLDEIDSIVVSLAASAGRAPDILLWGEQPTLSPVDLVRNRRELLPRPDQPTIAVIRGETVREIPFAADAHAARALRRLFLSTDPRGGQSAVRAIEIVPAAELLASRPAGHARLTVGGEIRDALFTRIPGEVSYTTAQTTPSQILFGLSAQRVAGPVHVTLTMTARGTTKVLFDRSVDAGDRWQDSRVPLPASGAATLTLRAESDRPGGTLLWGSPVIVPVAPVAGPRKVILYLVDALRADHLHFYGYPKATSPFLDGLARDGLTYRHAYGAASWTKPSIASLLTGLYPQTHGVGAKYYSDPLPDGVETLQTRLGAFGYLTTSFSANPLGSTASGLDRGFDQTFTAAALTAPGEPGKVRAADLHRRALAWIEEHAADRFFLFVHSVDTHPPFPGMKDSPGAGPQSEVDAYDKAVSYADAEIGRFYHRLEELGLASGTLLIVTADHGRGLGERGWTGHGQSVYEEEIRVPLIFHLPRVIEPGVVDAPVQSIDVLPTILQYCATPPPEDGVQGRSLRGRPAGGSVFVSRFVYPDDQDRSRVPVDQHAVIDYPWKLIVTEAADQPRVELYDLGSDPGERHDVSSGESERVLRLQASLREFLGRQEQARQAFVRRHGDGGRAFGSLDGVLPPQLFDELKALGYVR